jgi:2-oxoglutarate/2-oxoacid ferredoxin oxidoreductase subunit beta
MRDGKFLKDEKLPFCKGCTHTNIAESTERALQKLELSPLDVILVSDIGCHGIIDKSMHTHTVHGLHGRSVALATGISTAIEKSGQKVIVFIGDGGVSIGMQHLIHAAHKNYDMTVVVHNNFLYGMTGGQPSEFTPQGFRTPTLPDGAESPPEDICEIVASAGANHVCRLLGIGDISEQLARAISSPGFSLVEVMEICPSYGMKANPGMKLSKMVESSGLEIKIFADLRKPAFIQTRREELPSLVESVAAVPRSFDSGISQPVRIMIAGSAGEGVQTAAELLARSAISVGLHVTKKGSYPVTVGIGFSASEIIISPRPIVFTGSPNPDIVVITSEDGLGFALPFVHRMKEGLVVVDSSLDVPENGSRIVRKDLRGAVRARDVSLFGVMNLLREDRALPLEALIGQIRQSRNGQKLKVDQLLEALN